MADTALNIISSAYQLTKIYAPTEPINSVDANFAVYEMNLMLDEWSNDTLACYANVENSFVLVAGQNQYTVGIGGNINVARPLKIDTSPGKVYLMDSNNNRYPLDVVEQDVWNSIGLLTETSQLPNVMFYDPQYPLGIINVFPTPLVAYTVYFDSRIQFSDIVTLTQTFSLPPGYMSAIRSNLAIRIWPSFKQGDPPGWLIEMARNSLAAIKRTNTKMSPAKYDSAIISRAKSSYNIYNDSTNRGTF